MKADDFGAFAALYDDVMALYGKAASATQKAMVFRALQAHSLPAVQAGFDAHVRDPQRGRFAPLPADILAQIEGAAENDGRPGAEEAWAMCLPAADEARTVVWTAEMAEAWGVALPVLHAGDEVGARMAFREAYADRVSKARKRREPVAWTPALGHDQRLRDEALRVAVDSGRLPLTALPAPAAQVAGLIELVQRCDVPEYIKAKAAALRHSETPRQRECREDRERTAQLKAESEAKVLQFMVRQGERGAA